MIRSHISYTAHFKRNTVAILIYKKIYEHFFSLNTTLIFKDKRSKYDRYTD